MHEKVAAYLAEQRRAAAAAEAQERERTLMDLDLYEAEYMPEGGEVAEYPELDDTGRRWRKVAIPVTDEEWAQIQQYAKKKDDTLVGALKILGAITLALTIFLSLAGLHLVGLYLGGMVTASLFAHAEVLRRLRK